MSPSELRASLSLASIFGLRMLGMFIILPVFTLWAQSQPGWNLELAGIAIGAYGLTQAILQIPMGRLSDRLGRKPLLYVGLAAMAAGSFVCASSATPGGMIAGRVLQGVGAISGVAIAFAADLTRETQRSKAMAIIGSTIGAAFAVSFVAAPSLAQWVGIHGIFAITGGLAIAAMVVAWGLVPDAPLAKRSPAAPAFSGVLRLPELLRLDFGIFTLHSVLMAMFVVTPVALVRAGLPEAHHWWVYLGAMAAGVVLMLPAVAARTVRRAAGVPRRRRGSRLRRRAARGRIGEHRGDCVGARHLLRRVQRSGSEAAGARLARGAAGCARGRHGRVFQRTVPRHVLRLGRGWGDRPALRLRRDARRLPRAPARVARRRVEHGRFRPRGLERRRALAGQPASRKGEVMASVNKVILIGNLGRDPETRYMPDGAAITNISVATTEVWKDKNGEKQEKTEWHRVAFFGKLAEIAGEYLKKGSQVYVEGRLQTREWEKDGVKRYSTEIVANAMQMLGSRQGMGGGAPPDRDADRGEGSSRPAASKPAAAKTGGKFDDFEDDIPF